MRRQSITFVQFFFAAIVLAIAAPGRAWGDPPDKFAFAQMRLLVCDYAAVRQFYERLLKLPVAFVGDQYVEFKTADGATLGVFAKSEMPGVKNDCPRASTVRNNDTVVVLRVVGLDQMARYLESQRVPVAVPATDRATWGVRTAHFVDPAGNLVELLEALPPK